MSQVLQAMVRESMKHPGMSWRVGVMAPQSETAAAVSAAASKISGIANKRRPAVSHLRGASVFKVLACGQRAGLSVCGGSWTAAVQIMVLMVEPGTGRNGSSIRIQVRAVAWRS